MIFGTYIVYESGDDHMYNGYTTLYFSPGIFVVETEEFKLPMSIDFFSLQRVALNLAEIIFSSGFQ